MFELPENNDGCILKSTLHPPVTPPLLFNDRVLLQHGDLCGDHPARYATRRLCSKGVEHDNPLETLTLPRAQCTRGPHSESFGGGIMQRRSKVGFVLACLLIVLSLSAKFAPAQAVPGALLGTVQDLTGAVVPGVNVTLTNEGTNVTNKATSGSQGFYTFPNLNPGQYTVTVEAKGFKKLVSTHNIVQVEQTTRVDMTLTPGEVTAEVTVTGTTPLVETTTSDLGVTIDQAQISNLPVNGRLAALVMQLAPGTTPAAWGAGNPEDASGAASTAPGGGGGGDYTSANGFPFEGNLYLVDGVSNVELMNAYMGIQIPFAMISEMKLETSDPTAEYGTVQPMHGRSGMMLSNARQFYGGPPKFKPTPRLARGFNAEDTRPPVSDPNLRSQGGRRAFMNTRDQETRPTK